MITVRPVVPARQRLVRMVFAGTGPSDVDGYRAWAGRLGEAVDASFPGPGERPSIVDGVFRPTVYVAAGPAVATALDWCRDPGLAPQRLVVLHGPGRVPVPAEPVGCPVTVLAAHGDLDPADVSRWRAVTTGPVSVRLFPVDRDTLYGPDSPAVPVLADSVWLGEPLSARRAVRLYGGQAPEFPVPRTDPYAPPAEYASVDGAPRRVRLAYGGQAWLVTGYRQSRAVLADPSFSSDATLPEYPNFPLASKRYVPGHFLSMDAPEHTRLRRTVAGDFSAAALKPLRPAILGHCATLVDAMVADGSPADLVDRVAVPLPAMVAAELLGVPVEDRPVFQAAARDLQVHAATAARRTVAGGRMNRYLAGLVENKRRRPGTDLLSRLAVTPQAQRGLDDEELIGVANLILVAGLETTAGLLGLTVLTLLREQAQGERVRADPARWAEPAVREALRYWTVVHHGVARVATRDVEVGGRTVRAGEAVVVHLPTANRDPSVFPAPERYDIGRDARGHLAFGHGMHRCLGAVLAQTQASAAVEVLFARLPGLRRADDTEEPLFLHDMLVYGVRRLPVAW